jgi:DNA invertase Pin-like site-specific DNA recombinase
MIDTPKPNQDEPTTSAQPIETVLPTMQERAPTGFGLVTQMHVGVVGMMGMMGMMGQMQLADIREKTRRDQAGLVRAGKSPGGLAYGYAVIAPQTGAKDAGDRKINPAEARIVERIYRDSRPAWRRGRSPPP